MKFPQDYREFIENHMDLNYSNGENPQLVLTGEQLLEMLDRLDTYDPFTKTMNTEFIKICVNRFVSNEHELELLDVTPEFVSSLKNWLMRIELKIKDVKPLADAEEDENGQNHTDLIHLYFHRKHLREITKYL